MRQFTFPNLSAMNVVGIPLNWNVLESVLLGSKKIDSLFKLFFSTNFITFS